jgi:hypothetical protein
MKQREGDEKSRTAGAETVDSVQNCGRREKVFPVKDVHSVDRSALDCESLFNDDRSTDAVFYQ